VARISKMAKTHNNLYPKIYSLSNLILAWRKVRKHKTKKFYVKEFEDNLIENLLKLQEELKNKTHKPKPLKTLSFIYDSCANRIGKGNLFALKRFYKFARKVSRNGKFNGWFNKNQVKGYVLKADIRIWGAF
jgi:hypothetical protein